MRLKAARGCLWSVAGPLLCLLVVTACVLHPVSSVKLIRDGGLSARPFRDEASIVEVECNSAALGSDMDVHQMKLFHAQSDVKYTAFVNPLKRECLTSLSFSSCVIDDADSRKTKLLTLVVGMEEGEERDYGCNVSTSRPGESIGVTAWRIRVRSISELQDRMVMSSPIK